MVTPIAELIAKRTRDAKHFTTDVPGTYIATIKTGQHYLTTAGMWDDTANFVQPVTGGWAGSGLDVRFGVENSYLTITYKGASMQMRPTAVYLVDRTAPATRNRKLADASYANVTRDTTSGLITVHDIFPGTDLNLTIEPDGITKAFVIRSKPTLPDPVALGWDPTQTYLIFAWDVQKPAGATVVDAVTGATVAAGYVGSNDLLVQDGTGTTIVTFNRGVAAGVNGISRPVWYVSAGATVPFGEAITYANTQAALYPVTVDPTTTIAISTTANDGYLSYDTSFLTYSSYTTASGLSWGSSNPGGKGAYDTYLRTYLRFDLSSLAGATLSAASLYGKSAGIPSGTYTGAVGKVADWAPLTANAATWNLATTALGTFPSPATVGTWYSCSLTLAPVQASVGGILPLKIVGTEIGSTAQSIYDYSAGSANAAYLSLTYTTGGATTQTGSFTANADLRATKSGSFSAAAVLRRTSTSPLTLDAYLARVGIPLLVSPSNGSVIGSNPVLVFTIPSAIGNMHFDLVLDTAAAFNTANLRELKTNVSQVGWEYYNGTGWTPFPATGVPNTYSGQQCRYTVQTALSTATWYWRVRGGA